MKYTAALIVLLLLALFSALFAQEKPSPQHREWLETVSPIITRMEKEIFLKLRTERERDKFIRFFWRQRDLKPDTEENEFFKEFTGRVRFADTHFSHGSGKRGSQTERGYYHLLLGPPLERHFYTTHSQLWPLELWYYKGEEEYGLPAYFYLIFYQPQGMGEYRLYDPDFEGPEKLVIPALYTRTQDRKTAHQLIKKISSELAGASLSYLPGEGALETAHMTSTSIIASARSLAEKKFSDTYARNYLRYKDHVETEYSDWYIESGFRAGVFKNKGQYFVHWALEPGRMNFALDDAGKVYFASFELVLRMEDGQGNPVFEKQEEIPLRITPEEYKANERRLFSFQDILPVIPGNFKLLLLLKNKTAKDFTSSEAGIQVPRDRGEPVLRLLLYHGSEKIKEPQKNALKAFAFEGSQYLVNTRNEFLPQKEMGVYLQAGNLDSRLRGPDVSVQLEVISLETGAQALSVEKPAAEVFPPEKEDFDFGGLSLAALKPGYYQVEVSLRDRQGNRLLSSKENIVLLSQAYQVIPWVYSRLHGPYPDAEKLFVLGTQYFLMKDYEKAEEMAEEALRKKKDDPGIGNLLAKSLFALHRFQDSLAVCLPLYQRTGQRETAKVIALNYAGLKDWASALVYLEKLMEEAVELSVINLAAECHLSLNRPDRALPLLRKSLELDPSQPAIIKLEERARKMLEKKE